MALTVEGELAAHADALRATHVQRAQHTAEQARRRYLAADPDNRLVADALEADWNARLRELAAAHDDYDHTTHAPATLLTDDQRQRIRALAADFPARAASRRPRTPDHRRATGHHTRRIGAAEHEAQFADELTMPVSTVVLTTGYRRNHTWIHIPEAPDEDGRLRHDQGVAPVAGLCVLGQP